MNSSELSSRAGVTVRALRHYHQVGVLPEPARSHNGYRQYQVQDLIRVLRIKRLASLGVALDRMPALLDDDGSDASTELDRLDAELDAEIERLLAQRSLIARIRQARSALDVPPELGRYLVAATAAGLSPGMTQLDREQSVLLAHLVGDEGMPELTRMYEAVSSPDVLAQLTELNGRFELCGTPGADEDPDVLVEDFVLALDPLAVFLRDLEFGVDLTASLGLFADYAAERLNPTQQYVMSSLAARFEG